MYFSARGCCKLYEIISFFFRCLFVLIHSKVSVYMKIIKAKKSLIVWSWWRIKLDADNSVKRVSWLLDPGGGQILSEKVHFSLTFDGGFVEWWILVLFTRWEDLISSIFLSIIISDFNLTVSFMLLLKTIFLNPLFKWCGKLREMLLVRCYANSGSLSRWSFRRKNNHSIHNESVE